MGTSFAFGGSKIENGTIAAVSTPWGEGGIGIVRISGQEALAVADRVLQLAGGGRLIMTPPRTIVHGKAVTPDGTGIDEVIAFYFRAPKSYTCEDLVEIQGHGGPVVMRRLLETVLSAGASLAEPGEFTRRAVINGRINLVQAEAVLDLIRAKTAAASTAALRRLTGEDGGKILEVEKGVLSLLAEVEAGLDFPEDVPEPLTEAIGRQAHILLGDLDAVLKGAKMGRLLSEGATVVIAGRPNVGKSSLLNALLGQERAIVTDLPGTTRDAVSEEAALGGIPVRLVDTAGLAPAGGKLETMGMERSRKEIARADLVLLVLDASEQLTPLDEEIASELASCLPGIVVRNKSDKPSRLTGLPAKVESWPNVTISALTGNGLDLLVETMVEALGGRLDEGVPALSHLRQIETAREARRALGAFGAGLSHSFPWDVLAEDLRACLAALGRLTGREIGPDLMHEIFSRFCVGK